MILRPRGYAKVLALSAWLTVSAAMALLGLLSALAQESIQDSLIREQESGNHNQNQAPGATVRGPAYDPCYLAQNAMRPCTPKNAAIAWSPTGWAFPIARILKATPNTMP